MTAEQIEKSIIDLHLFFQGWLSGGIERSQAEFSQLEEALDPHFTMINPDGSAIDRTAVLSMETAHAAVPGLVIEIAHFNLIAGDGSLAVATYDELQRWPGGANSRRSTAIFVSPPNPGEQYRWRHVHETWLDTGSQS